MTSQNEIDFEKLIDKIDMEMTIEEYDRYLAINMSYGKKSPFYIGVWNAIRKNRPAGN